MRVLVATDGTDNATHAARRAVQLLRPGADITLVNVAASTLDAVAAPSGFAGPIVSPEEAERLEELADRAGREAMESTARSLQADAVDDSQVHRELLHGGSPGAAIVRYAAEHDTDLIVLGESQKGWFERLISGSAMHHIISHAPCPVLVIPGDDA